MNAEASRPLQFPTETVENLHRALREAGWRLAVAESCTGGLLGAAVTSVPGSSDVFLGGIVAYDNRIKRQHLDVDERVLEEDGAVSEPVARAMAEGVRGRLGADLGVSITGVAGPGGGTRATPVGRVYVGVADAAGQQVRCLDIDGGRSVVRLRSVRAALDEGLAFMDSGMPA